MQRAVVAATVVVASLAGAALGGVLHHTWGGPFGRAVSRPAAAPSTTPSPTPADPKPSPRPRASATGSSTPAPAFTHRALLEPPEFVARGWAKASRTDEFSRVPDPPITPCATVSPDQAGILSGYAATYAGLHTDAAEVVVRFRRASQAEAALDRMRTSIAGCSDSGAHDAKRILQGHQPQQPDVSEMRWWNTVAVADPTDRGVIAIGRIDDRVVLLSLHSGYSDPAVTTDVDSLLTQAARRLV